jgi:Reverse transcriptase (RNA-dependent DNA polymerase)
MGLLVKGDDMTHEVPKRRQDVAPEAFKIHLENLFGKESLGETFGLLTADQVGPKSELNMELSRPPTLQEIQLAIGRLRDGTAPGANGLWPEIFYAGGAILAHRLQQDFGVICPATSRGPDLNPEPNLRTDDTGGDPPQAAAWESSQTDRVKVFQAWQDAEVITLFKGKRARSDPSNYRGIFLLDVAGKILATMIERWLKHAAECWLDDSQNVFREKRSTSMSIHVLRRIQEACRSADLKAFAVFVDFKKAFDSPPRKALYECQDWIGIPPELLSMIMAINECLRGKVRGSSVWFKVAWGVRQGCVLGPTMFIIILEFYKRMAGLKSLGIKFACVKKKQISLPADLSEATF